MDAKHSNRLIALVLWTLISLAEFIGLPIFLSIGFGIGGLPEEAQHLANPSFYIWWQAVLLGLPIWIPCTCVCLWVIRRNRDV